MVSPPNVDAFSALTIVESQEAADTIEGVFRLFPRAEEAYEAYKWRLARSPDDPGSFLIPGTFRRLIRFNEWVVSDDTVVIPSLTFDYEFDANRVLIHAIRVASGL